MVARIAGGALRHAHTPGRSLHLLPEAELPTDLSWASPAPTVAAALARFVAVVEQAGEKVLAPAERDHLLATLAAWDGSDPPLGRDWVEAPLADLQAQSRPAARLAVYAALAPYRIDEGVVREFRRSHPDDGDLVAAVAWSAFQTPRHIGSWLAEPVKLSR